MSAVQFLLNGRPASEDSASPSMTALDWLRARARLSGTKEGCAEGDCGACTIVLGRAVEGSLQYEAVNSCLMMLPQIANCDVLTVEGLAATAACIPCSRPWWTQTPPSAASARRDSVMAMFAFHHCGEGPDESIIHEALAGNLCRCTGYRSIVEACQRIARGPAARFALGKTARAQALASLPPCLHYRTGAQVFIRPRTLGELFAAIAELPDALLLAGGTDLGLRASKDREVIPAIIALDAINDLRQIESSPDALDVGGAVTYTQALPHLDRHFPSFAALVRRIGSREFAISERSRAIWRRHLPSAIPFPA